jgi:hypothetical protein
MHINVHTGDNHETSQSGGRRYRYIEWGNRNFCALLATAFPGHLNSRNCRGWVCLAGGTLVSTLAASMLPVIELL